jgi:hypothetical protein
MTGGTVSNQDSHSKSTFVDADGGSGARAGCQALQDMWISTSSATLPRIV